MLTGEAKTFTEIIFTLLYGMDHWELWESSLAKDEKRLDWTNLQRSCIKSGCPGASHAVAYRGLCVSLTSDAIGGSD